MSDNTPNKSKSNMPKFNLSWFYMIIALGIGFLFFFGDGQGEGHKQVTYTEFKEMVNKGYGDKIVAYNDNTVDMFIKPQHVRDVFKENAKNVGRSPFVHVEIGSTEALEKFLEKAQEEGKFTGSIQFEKKSEMFGAIFWNIFPILFIVGMWIFIMRRMSGGGGGGANPFNVGKSRAQVYEKDDKALRITFKDVAGQEGAKQEVQEIVDFLKQPGKYTELGGKYPQDSCRHIDG